MSNKKKKYILVIAIIAVIFSSGLIISNQNKNISNALTNKNEKNIINDNRIEQNQEEVPKVENSKEESNEPQKEELTTTNKTTNESKQEQKDKVNKTNNTSTNKNKKEEAQTTKKEETNTNNKKEENKVEVPEPTEITKLSFEKDYVTKEIYGYPPNQFTGSEVVIVIPSNTPSISLSNLQKLNKLTVYPAKFADSNITWSSTNDSVAKLENDKLNIFRFGEVTITATAENGVSASYKLKIVGQISTSAFIRRQQDYTKYTMPHIVAFQLNHRSESKCPYIKYKYDIELKLYKDGILVKTQTYQSNNDATYLSYNDEAGTYYGEYTVTDNCTNYTKKGKTPETVITIPVKTETQTKD